MSLKNLLRIGQLEEHVTDASQVQKMLDSCSRCFADAREKAISPESRLDIAYRGIMQPSMVAHCGRTVFGPAKANRDTIRR